MRRPFDFSPKEPTTEPTTLRALKSWMKESGCNFASYRIDSAPISEGFTLAKVGSSYHWVFAERGLKTVEKVFADEGDAVSFAYNQIKNDRWAWSLMVGFVKDTEELKALKSSLTKMQIPYFEDAIPYGGKDDLRYRVYVHNSKAEAVSDLRKRYA